MTCHRFRDVVARQLPGQVTKTVRDGCMAHLMVCVPCNKILDQNLIDGQVKTTVQGRIKKAGAR